MNALRYAHVMSRLIDAPLWAHPVKAAIVYNALAGDGRHAIPLPDDPLLPALSAPAGGGRKPARCRRMAGQRGAEGGRADRSNR